ncbi:hypothetical protein [Carboxylicivirga sp. RSCT41]|uniref:hypothetical protein n=1 Tax=Carboxylicivirga agarovorans TaxID=3417570 RepID=UPI003D3567C8
MAKKAKAYTATYTGKGGHIRELDKEFKTKKELEKYLKHYNIANYKIKPIY